VDGTYLESSRVFRVDTMQVDLPLTAAHISVETSASADLDDVCRWLIECQANPVRLDVRDLPALGQSTRLRLALPVTAPRAVLSTVSLLEDVDAGGCLLTGHLRFVAHPTEPDIRLSFRGRAETAMGSSAIRRQAAHAARELLDVIAASIERPFALRRLGRAAS
jgi:hypothetical protein